MTSSQQLILSGFPETGFKVVALIHILGELFPDAVFHQGADEVLDPAEGFVHEQCWQVSAVLCRCPFDADVGPSRPFFTHRVLAELTAHRRLAEDQLPTCQRKPWCGFTIHLFKMNYKI